MPKNWHETDSNGHTQAGATPAKSLPVPCRETHTHQASNVSGSREASITFIRKTSAMSTIGRSRRTTPTLQVGMSSSIATFQPGQSWDPPPSVRRSRLSSRPKARGQNRSRGQPLEWHGEVPQRLPKLADPPHRCCCGCCGCGGCCGGRGAGGGSGCGGGAVVPTDEPNLPATSFLKLPASLVPATPSEQEQESEDVPDEQNNQRVAVLGESLSFDLYTTWVTHSHTHSLTHSLTRSLARSLTRSLSHSLTPPSSRLSFWPVTPTLRLP